MIDDAEHQRFEQTENGLISFVDYRRHETRCVLLHVEADPGLRGTGAASRLMEAIVAHARAKGLTLAPRCSYAVSWFKNHPDAGDVIG